VAYSGAGLPLAYAVMSALSASVSFGLLNMYACTAEAAFYERAGGVLRYKDEV
jgi:hypothetical protein